MGVLDFSLGGPADNGTVMPRGSRVARPNIPDEYKGAAAGNWDWKNSTDKEKMGVFGMLAKGYGDYVGSKAAGDQLRWQAKGARGEGAVAAQNIMEKGKAAEGELVNQLASSGVSISSGSAKQAQQFVANRTISNATQALIQGKLQAMRLRTQAKIGEMKGRDSLFQSLLSAGSGAYSAGKAPGTSGATK